MAPLHGPDPLVLVFPVLRATVALASAKVGTFSRMRPRPAGRMSRLEQSTHLGGEPEWEVLLSQTSQSD